MGKQKETVQPVIPKEEVKKQVVKPTTLENGVGKNLEKTKQNNTNQKLVVESNNNQNLTTQKPPVVISSEQEKLRQQQLQVNKQAVDTKKIEQQALEEKRKEEQEILQKQEEERKKLEQEKMFGAKNQPNPQILNSGVASVNNTSSQIVSPDVGIAPSENQTPSTINHSNVGQNTQISPNSNLQSSSENQKGGPSTIKRVMAIILFVALMAMVYFLPEITSFMNSLKEKNTQEKITSGVLECNLKKSNKTLDIDIKALFSFTNSQLYKLEYTTVHTGDKTEDKEQLNELNESCLLLKQEAGELEGVTISCSLNNGIHSNKQILDYEKLEVKEVTSAYTEAGGVYPAEFQKSENIDKIESEMIANNYTCKRR